MNRARMAPIAATALAGLASLAGVAGCSSAASTATLLAMPAEPHHLPTVLGPLSGSGNRTLSVVARSAMSIEIGCRGKPGDLAWVRSAVGSFAAVCGDTPGDGAFATGYDSAQDLRDSQVKPGERVPVRIIAPAGDTWQLWITGG